MDDFAVDLARRTMKELGGNRPVGAPELAGVAKLLLLAGHVSPTQMLTLGALTLLEEERTWYTALHKDPARTPAVVEELLRHITVKQFGLIRRATRDTVIGGVVIGEGQWVICSLRAGAYAPHGRPADYRFDPLGHQGDHLAFGHGPHQCLGQSLSRVILEAGLTVLARGLPGLHLAAGRQLVPFRDSKTVYGVESLPVAW
ncbi:cytochrome P450 [Streptomyces sp. NPDC058612]|uniref:cytochrome P450 n=1 Tax=Streptomyces sp. NPDC058612 TaxID=3346555 RepID=UPI003656F163